MRIRIHRKLLLSVCLLGAVPGCGDHVMSAAPAGVGIVNGNAVRSGDRLSHSVVALLARQPKGVALCTGSILDEQTILTAAHCVDDQPTRITVIFGPRVKGAKLAMLRSADRSVQNPRWQRHDGQGDLALVHFGGGLPAGFQAVQLAAAGTSLPEGTEVVMLGYGVSDGVGHVGAGVLRETSTTVVGGLNRTQILTDGRESSVCFGDSGGPGFISSPGGYLQWGVASSVLDQACNEASVHTNVIAYGAWIRRTMAQMAHSEKNPN